MVIDLLKQKGSIRYIVLVGAVILLRIFPVLNNWVETNIFSNQWHILSLKAAEGYLPYKDIFTSIGPLTLLINYFITIVLGPLQTVGPWIAGVLIIGQMVQLTLGSATANYLLGRSLLLPFFFLLICSYWVGFYHLHPYIIANLFLISAFHLIVKHIRYQPVSDEVLLVGACMGVCAMLDSNLLFMVVWPLLIYLLYTGATAKQILLLFLGAATPLLVGFLWFYWHDAGSEYISFYLVQAITFSEALPIGYLEMLKLFAIPLGFGVFFIFSVFGNNKFINFQSVINNVVVLWLLVAFAAIALRFTGDPEQFILLAPPVAIQFTHFFELRKRSWLTEIFGTIVILGFLFMLTAPKLLGRQFYKDFEIAEILPYEASDESLLATIKNQKIWVVGQDLRPYIGNKLGGPFLEIPLAKSLLNDYQNYESILKVYNHLSKDWPTVIIKENDLLDSLFLQMPVLKKEYEYWPQKNIYIKKGAQPF